MGDNFVCVGQKPTRKCPGGEVVGTKPYTLETTVTDNTSGSAAVQLELKHADGKALTAPVSGLLYLSEDAEGKTHDGADTSLAVLTNGALTVLGGDSACLFTTTEDGKLGVTVNASDDDYYLVLVMPAGDLLISDEITIEGN